MAGFRQYSVPPNLSERLNPSLRGAEATRPMTSHAARPRMRVLW